MEVSHNPWKNLGWSCHQINKRNSVKWNFVTIKDNLWIKKYPLKFCYQKLLTTKIEPFMWIAKEFESKNLVFAKIYVTDCDDMQAELTDRKDLA